MRAVHLFGAPGAGKSYLAGRLAADVSVPAFDIDTERRKLTRPGESWPADASLAWERIRAGIEDHAAGVIVETSGLAPMDGYLFDGVTVFRIRVHADDETRNVRLLRRVLDNDPVALGQRNYVERLLNYPEPPLTAKATWDGSERPTQDRDYVDLLAAVQRFLA